RTFRRLMRVSPVAPVTDNNSPRYAGYRTDHGVYVVHHWQRPFGRQWLIDATALPPFTAGDRDVPNSSFGQSNARHPDASRQGRASAAPQGGRVAPGIGAF